ncbi:hypothetical protein ACFPTO_22255 [Paraburkholderia denitrificans]|uniref:Uncharacterized protein n=1 Tax=Paraburkholderia denitrificans TaxID=694025 RepID=A0ABW0JEP0_9BURK
MAETRAGEIQRRFVRARHPRGGRFGRARFAPRGGVLAAVCKRALCAPRPRLPPEILRWPAWLAVFVAAV